ncbi:discoidin domain-containing protein [Epibacterium ulvae]|uniref:discoidin domain-containing protein n=1 Tax=Epibacterium ulvae TaxID=1156985 RepID=UPI001BFC90E9|nr:discoidin domain-containing protein [Epibacterium ulvae]MBT8152963.1 discoidin domain-containing protein [Epibacterium ulvae]
MKPTLLSTAILLSTSATLGQAATVNWALEGTATVSAGASSASLAIDGDTNTSWNAGRHPFNFIEIDLGQVREFSAVRALVGQRPNGNTLHNVFLDNVLSYTWDQHTSGGDWLTFELPEPTQAQVVRIDTVRSPSWTAWNEIQVLQGDIAPVPLPASALLLLGSFFSFGWLKRRSTKGGLRILTS